MIMTTMSFELSIVILLDCLTTKDRENSFVLFRFISLFNGISTFVTYSKNPLEKAVVLLLNP